MNVITLDTHELRELYRHALHETYRAEMQALSIFSWIVDNARSPALRGLALAEMDLGRANLDRLDDVIRTADPKLSHEIAARQPVPFDESTFGAKRFTSARVRDFAMSMTAQSMSDYRLMRYRALVNIAKILHSDTLLDGFRLTLTALDISEARMTRLQGRL